MDRQLQTIITVSVAALVVAALVPTAIGELQANTDRINSSVTQNFTAQTVSDVQTVDGLEFEVTDYQADDQANVTVTNPDTSQSEVLADLNVTTSPKTTAHFTDNSTGTVEVTNVNTTANSVDVKYTTERPDELLRALFRLIPMFIILGMFYLFYRRVAV